MAKPGVNVPDTGTIEGVPRRDPRSRQAIMKGHRCSAWRGLGRKTCPRSAPLDMPGARATHTVRAHVAQHIEVRTARHAGACTAHPTGAHVARLNGGRGGDGPIIIYRSNGAVRGGRQPDLEDPLHAILSLSLMYFNPFPWSIKGGCMLLRFRSGLSHVLRPPRALAFLR